MGFYEGRYVEVNWEPEHFMQRWGMRAPEPWHPELG